MVIINSSYLGIDKENYGFQKYNLVIIIAPKFSQINMFNAPRTDQKILLNIPGLAVICRVLIN